MGGLITARYMQNFVSSNFYPQKVFLSSPAAAAPGVMGAIIHNGPKMIPSGLSKQPFSFPLKGTLDLRKLTHDKRVYQNYIKDPKNILAIETKLMFEIVKAAKDTFTRPLRIECPLYCSIGTGDELVNPSVLIDYFKTIEKNAE